MTKPSSIDPVTLRQPGNLSEAIIAKVHAENQLAIIHGELTRLRALDRAWRRRRRLCIKVIELRCAEGTEEQSNGVV